MIDKNIRIELLPKYKKLLHKVMINIFINSLNVLISNAGNNIIKKVLISWVFLQYSQFRQNNEYSIESPDCSSQPKSPNTASVPGELYTQS